MPSRVTVVLAVHNGEDYVDEAIQSVRRQTLADWQLLVIDDGSTDGSTAIAARHVAEDHRIRLVRQANAGVAAARNLGVREATTRWIAILDHDDVFLPTKLERQLQFLDAHPEIKCLGTWGHRIGTRGWRLGTFDAGPTTPGQFRRLRDANRLIYLLAASVVFDRKLALSLGGFREEPGGTEDVDLWNRIADRDVVQALPERLVLYRVHGASVSATKLATQRMNTVRLEQNIALRRSGRDEVGVADFAKAWDAQPAAAKRASDRRTRSLALYRHAGGLLADRNPAGLWYLLRSAWLQPMSVARRAVSQLGLRRRG